MPPRDRTRRRAAPRQARAQASLDAILGATELLLHEHGYRRLTTNRIAARAGVNVALVYRYFAGKEAIVGALIDRFAAQTHQTIVDTLASHTDAPLGVAIRALLDVLVAAPAPALHRELVERVEIAGRRDVVQKVREAAAAQFRTFLLARRAELRRDLDLEATLFVVEHTIEAATHAAAFYRPAGLSMERVLATLTDLLVTALAAETGRSGWSTTARGRRNRTRSVRR
jgi:AcrR family transcriptional regulator